MDKKSKSFSLHSYWTIPMFILGEKKVNVIKYRTHLRNIVTSFFQIIHAIKIVFTLIIFTYNCFNYKNIQWIIKPWLYQTVAQLILCHDFYNEPSQCIRICQWSNLMLLVDTKVGLQEIIIHLLNVFWFYDFENR